MKRTILFKTILLSLALLSVTGSFASDLWWTGAIDNDWSTIGNWSTTDITGPGGTVNANTSPPGPADNVHFVAESFPNPQAYTITTTGTIKCKDLTFVSKGMSTSLTFQLSGDAEVYGSLSFLPTTDMTFNTSIVDMSFRSSAVGNTIDFAGQSFQNLSLDFNSPTGEWTFNSGIVRARRMFFINGSLIFGDFDYNIWAFQSIVDNSERKIDFANAVITTTTSSGGSDWDILGTMTRKTGTPTIYLQRGSFQDRATVTDGSVLNLKGVIREAPFTGLFGYTVNGNAVTCDSLINKSAGILLRLNGVQNLDIDYIEVSGSENSDFRGPTVTLDTFVTNVECAEHVLRGAKLNYRNQARAGLRNVRIEDGIVGTVNGAAPAPAIKIEPGSLLSGTLTGFVITPVAPRKLYWVGNTGEYNEPTNWSLTSGGTPLLASDCPPQRVDDVYFDANSFSADGQKLEMNSETAFCEDMYWIGLDQSGIDWEGTNDFNISGSLILDPMMKDSLSYDQRIIFLGANDTVNAQSGTNHIAMPFARASVGGGTDYLQTSSNVTFASMSMGSLASSSYDVGGNGDTLTLGGLVSVGNLNLTDATMIIERSAFSERPFFNIWRSDRPIIKNENSKILLTDPVLSRIVESFSDFPTICQTDPDGKLSVETDNLRITGSLEVAGILESKVSMTVSKNIDLGVGKTHTFLGGKTITADSLLVKGTSCGEVTNILTNNAMPISLVLPANQAKASFTSFSNINYTSGGTLVVDGTDNVDGGGNTNLDVGTSIARTFYWRKSPMGGSFTGDWHNPLHWTTTKTDAFGQNDVNGCIPSAIDSVVFDNLSGDGSAVAVTLSTNESIKSMTWVEGALPSGMTWVVTANNSLRMSGQYTLASNMTTNLDPLASLFFEGSDTTWIDTKGIPTNGMMFIDNGVKILKSELNGLPDLRLRSGVFNSNKQDVNLGYVTAHIAGARSLILDSSYVSLNQKSFPFNNGTGVIQYNWLMLNTAGLTYSGKGTVIESDVFGTIRFQGGGLAYEIIKFTAVSGVPVLAGDNTISDSLIFNSDATIIGSNTVGILSLKGRATNTNYTFEAGETTTFLPEGAIIKNGDLPQFVNISSSLVGTRHQFEKPTGSNINVCNINVTDVNANENNTSGPTFRTNDASSYNGETPQMGNQPITLPANTTWNYLTFSASSVVTLDLMDDQHINYGDSIFIPWTLTGNEVGPYRLTIDTVGGQAVYNELSTGLSTTTGVFDFRPNISRDYTIIVSEYFDCPGQFENGTITNSTTPVKVPPLTNGLSADGDSEVYPFSNRNTFIAVMNEPDRAGNEATFALRKLQVMINDKKDAADNSALQNVTVTTDIGSSVFTDGTKVYGTRNWDINNSGTNGGAKLIFFITQAELTTLKTVTNKSGMTDLAFLNSLVPHKFSPGVSPVMGTPSTVLTNIRSGVSSKVSPGTIYFVETSVNQIQGRYFLGTTTIVSDPSQGNETLTTSEDATALTSGNLVTNNVDPDGTTVTVSTIVSTTGNGTVTITNGGTTVDYTPFENFNGVDTVIYTACDEDLPAPSCVNDTLFVTVTPVNDDPSNGNETLTTSEGSTVLTSGNLVNNNVDPDGTAVTVTSVVSTTGNGTVTITNGGTTVDYTPFGDFNGVDTIIYTVCDGDTPTPSCVNDTLFVTVTSVNDDPSNGNETLTTSEDASALTSGNLVTNNVDPDGTTVTVSTIVSTTGNGTVTITNGGTTVDYTPFENFNGVDTVIYTACDEDLPAPSCVNDTLFVTVTPVNDDPSNGNETLTTSEGSTVLTSGNLVNNNVDPDGTAVTVTSVVSTTGNGTVTITNGGTTVDYTPFGDFNGVDTIIYTVCDGDTPTPSCVNDTLFVTVTSVNDDPSQGNETLTTSEDASALTSGNLVTNNVDPDGTAVTVSTIVSTTGNGTVTITNGGTTVDYTPFGDFNGVDTIIYTVCDGDAPTPSCVNDTLFVTVTSVNDDPSQGNETLTTSEDASALTSGNLVTNNVDPDGTTVTVSTIVSTTGNGTVTITNGGTTVDYTPFENFNGVDTVIYTACDEDLPTPSCVNDTLFVTVTPVNDDPSNGNETLTTSEGSTVLTSGNLVNNNVDPDGTAVTVTSVVSTTGNGTVTITNGGTTVDYTPFGDFNGVDTIIYTVCDGDTPTPSCVNDTLFVTVTSVNDDPSQGNETLTTSEDASALTSGNLVTNNVDPDGTTVTVSTIVSTTGNGTVTITNGGTTVDYTPFENFNGVDTVIYTACDEDLPTPSCVNDTLFVTVTPVNDDPSNGNETLTTSEGATVLTSGNLVNNNVDPDGTAVTVTSVVSTTGNGTVTITNGGTTVDYTPLGDFNGVDTIIYTVCDGDTPTPSCVNDTLFVTVTSVNDDPSQGNETLTTSEDASALTSGNLVTNNVDPDGTAVTVSTIVSTTGNGTVTITNGGTTVDYTPFENFNGVDTIIYTVCDGDTPTPSCVNDTLFVTVTPVNDDPSNGNETLTTSEDATVLTSGNLVNNNVDPDGTAVTVTSVVSTTGNGTVTITNGGTTVDYTPLGDFNGVDTIIYTVCDGDTPTPSCVNDTLFVTVTSVNDDPSQGNETLTTSEDASALTSGNLVTNNVDPDGTAVTVSTIVSTTGNGTVTITNGGTTVDYTPFENFNGVDTVIYTACDEDLPTPSCVNDTLFVTVTPVNDDPSNGNETLTTSEDATVLTSGNLVNNNVDPDGTAVTVTSVVSTTGNGTVTITNGGTTVDYTPLGDFNGVDTIIYTVCDGDTPTPSCVNDTLFVTVTSVNDDPDAVTDNATTMEGVVIIVDVQANDTDLEGDALSTSVLVGASNGTLSVLNGDSLSYTPDTDFNGVDTIVYQICDGGGLCDSDTLFVTVTPVNDDPVIVDGSGIPIDELVIVATEDEAIEISINGTDADGDNIDITNIIGGPKNGTISNVGNGDTTFTYIPDSDFNGNDTLLAVVCDDANPAGCDTVQVIVTVDPMNDDPSQGNDVLTTTEDANTITSGNVVINNVDPDGTAVTVTSVVSTTGGGTVTITNGGTTVDYTPFENFNGVDTVIYTVCDEDTPTRSCVNDTLFVTVESVNDNPIANDDFAGTDPGVSVKVFVQGNDSDIDGDVLTTSIVTNPTNGTAIVQGDSIVYTPVGTFLTGSDTVAYRVCDAGGLCDTAFVVIVVPTSELSPVGVEDLATVNEDETVTIDVLSNDTDGNGDELNISSTLNGPFHGTVSIVNNELVYVPNGDFNGADSLEYIVCDTTSPTPLCDTVQVKVTVTPANDDPVIVDNNGDPIDELVVVATEDEAIEISISGTDVDGDNIDITNIIGGPKNGTISNVGNGDTTFTYIPDSDFNGNDTLLAVVCDEGSPVGCDTVQVIVTVDPANDDPSNGNETLTTMEDATALTSGNLVANNVDPDGTAVTISTATAENGTVTITNGGTTVDYTPLEDFNGVDTVIYTVCDGDTPKPSCVKDTLFVTVESVNDDPVIVDGNGDPIDELVVVATEDEAIEISISGTDVDGDNIDITNIIGGPKNGTISNVGNGDTTFTYIPDSDFNGNDTLLAIVCDDAIPTGCDTVQVIVTVDPANDDPSNGNETLTTTEDATALTSGNLVANNVDPDGTAVTISTATAENGTVTITNGGTTVDYTPLEDFNGVDTVIYTVCDGDTPTPSCVNDTLFVTVESVNDDPVIVDGNGDPIDELVVVATEDEAIEISISGTDVDGDNIDITNIIGGPKNGTISNVGNGDTTFTYIPDSDFNGNDTLLAVVCDDANPAGCDTVQVIVTVDPMNDDPVIVDDSGDPIDELVVVATEDEAIEISISGTDVDGDNIDITNIIGGPKNGTISNVGNGDTTFTYIPDSDFNGNDTLLAVVCDDANPAGCDTVQVIVSVESVNDNPIANDDFAGTDPGVPVKVFVQGNDSDIDGDVLTTSIVTNPTNGTAIVQGDSIVYTPVGTFLTGSDTVEYRVCDAGGLCDTAFVIIVVPNSELSPVGVEDLATVKEDETVTIDVLSNDTDGNGDELNISSTLNGPFHGTVSIVNNELVYVPNGDFNGADSLEYIVCDTTSPTPLCDTVQVKVTVTPANDDPVIVDGNGDPIDELVVVATEDEAIEISINGTDVDGDNIDITNIIGGPKNGTISNVGNGDTTFTYIPDSDFNGNDTLLAVVCDDANPAGCDTVQVIVTVDPMNDDPSQGNDVLTTTEDANTITSGDLVANNVDPDGTAVTVTSVVSTTGGGTVTITNGGTTVDYTPFENFNGVDTVVYTVCDEDTPTRSCVNDTLFVTVESVNDNPIANDDFAGTDPGVSVKVFVQGNDSDIDGDILTTSIVTNPTNGTAIVQGDSIVYTPVGTFLTGSDTVEYRVCDAGGLCDTAFVIIVVPNSELSPVGVEDLATVKEGETVTIDVLSNDTDGNGDELNISSTLNGPFHGTVSIVNNELVYVPNGDFNGADSLEYIVCDTTSPTPLCDTVQVKVTVTPVNDDPVIVDNNGAPIDELVVVATEGNAIEISINGTDVDGDNIDITNIIGGPKNGTISNVGNGDTTFTYIPDSDFNGNDTLLAVVCDEGSPTGCDTVQVIVTVDPANDDPSQGNDVLTTTEDANTITSGNLVTNNVDPDGTAVTVTSVVSTTGGGTVTITNGGTTVDYTPFENFNGVDTVILEVCDGDAPTPSCVNDTLFVTVESVNDGPDLTSNTGTVSQVGTTVINVLSNDTDIEGDSLIIDESTITSTEGAVVTVDTDGNLVVDPVDSFTGVDTIIFTVCDDGSPAQCSNDTLIITVESTNEDPVTENDIADVTISGTTTVDVLANDTDPDNHIDPTTLVVDSLTSGNTVTVVDGKIEYVANTDFVGVDTVWYSITDADGNTTQGILIVNISIGDVKVYTGVSPNGDGDNDVLYIDGLQRYPGNKLSIYNRWGNLIYEVTDYDSEDSEKAWRGQSNHGLRIGNEVVDGTYFYVLDLNDGKKGESGYLMLSRLK